MASLESSIDALYQGPLGDFVDARKALAKMLKGEDAQRVKQLQKPTSVAWAVNQLYWHRRAVFDRLVKSGKKLRTAQVGALSGHRVDLRGPAEDHRSAIGDAVSETVRLTAESAVHPNGDELSRTLEALSLDPSAGGEAGRLTKALQPAGFEALAGLVMKSAAKRPERSKEKGAASTSPEDVSAREARREAEGEAERRRQEEEEESRRKKADAVKHARAALERAKEAEEEARSSWEQRKKERAAAEKVLAELE